VRKRKGTFLLSALKDNNDKTAILKGVFKTKSIHLYHDFYLSFNVFKIFVFMCGQKTKISSQIDLECEQSLDKRQTKFTGTENRKKRTRLSQSNMRHVVLNVVTKKITVSWNRAHCRLLFIYCLKFYLRPYSASTSWKSEISVIANIHDITSPKIVISMSSI
jgi:hypothetical protein